MSAWADQIAAARRETERVNGVLRQVIAGKEGSHEKAQRWVEGWRASVPLQPGCSHAHSPTTLVGILTAPPVVYCPTCAVAAMQRHVANHPDHCDTCGSQSRTFHEAVVRAGDVLHLFGHVCPACYATIRQVRP